MALTSETIKVRADQLLAEVQRLVHEGNVRRISIRQGERVVAEFPLTVGVVGAALAPILVAIGALAAVLTECSITIEREETPLAPPAPQEPEAEASGSEAPDA